MPASFDEDAARPSAGLGEVPAPATGEVSSGAATPQTGSSGPRHMPIRFTGSGSEYFRIWIVNLLLTIVTLTLYAPFAKARRLAYFHGNTLVDGHALGFHGDPWKMLRGYLLMVALAGVYALANHWSPVAALVAVVLMGAAWPALWRAALQFRLANTSWRGLRMRFDGDLAGAYKVMAPAFLPAVVLMAAVAFADAPAPVPSPPGEDAADPSAAPPPDPTAGLVAAAVMLAAMLLWPLLVAAVKRYQHGNYRYASQHTVLQAGTGAFYKLSAKFAGVSLLVGLVGVVVGGIAGFFSAGATHIVTDNPFQAQALPALVGMAAGMGTFYLLLLLVSLPYWQSRLQNLVWGATASKELQFHSALEMRPLALLTFKNAVLTVLTLGLYWPFAKVALTRMRLEAMSLTLDGDVEQWRADAAARYDDAAGDAAGDFFGIDVGL